MPNLPPALAIFRKIGLLVLAGVGAVTIARPLFTFGFGPLGVSLAPLEAASVVLTLALEVLYVALAALAALAFVWVFYRGRRAAGRGIRHLGHSLVTMGRRLLRNRILGENSLLTSAGVFIGVLVGVLTGAQDQDMESALFMNAIAGGLIAAAAGTTLTVWEKRAAKVHPGM